MKHTYKHMLLYINFILSGIYNTGALKVQD